MNSIVIFIIIANAIFSIQGFNKPEFTDKYIFSTGKILYNKEYFRLITSGFLHANYGHLIFNMLTFYFFAPSVLNQTGVIGFLLLYFGSLLGGNLLSLYLKKDQPHYLALGASGAVSGVLYAFILLSPLSKIFIFFIPIGIPAWLFGIIFIGISMFGMHRQASNIGHEAHLGGAITGLLIFIALRPDYFYQEWRIALIILAPTFIFLYLIIKKPEILNLGKKDDWQRWN